MNVLIVTGIFPPDIGGPATYIPVISGELAKRGHKVRVVTLSDTLNHHDSSYSFSVRRIRRSILKPLRFIVTVLRILQEGRTAQVLYVNGLYLEAAVANWFLWKPMVQKIVGDWTWERASNKRWVADSFEEFQKRRYGLKLEFLKSLRSFCVRRADAVIVPSRFLAGAVGTWGVAEGKIKVIYNAVEPTAPSAVQQNGNSPDLSSVTARPLSRSLSTRVKVVTVARLVPWKHVDHLIEVVSEFEDTALVIVGDGPERPRLENLVQKKQVADRVYFTGQTSKDDTFALMKACDLFVLNSSYEGFPHVVLEAMCAGLPVIATAAGGTSELVCDGENGLLIAPNGNGALKTSLRKLVSSTEERKQLAGGSRKTVDLFQRSIMVDATEAVLKACAV